jgi:hypothetical protein
VQGKKEKNPQAELQAGLRKWVRLAFGKTVIGKGRKFSTGKQDDGNSCGICVLNAMDHAMIGTPLFRHETREATRMDLFLRMINYLLEHVCVFPVECMYQ